MSFSYFHSFIDLFLPSYKLKRVLENEFFKHVLDGSQKSSSLSNLLFIRKINLLTLSQGHREVCHFQGRDTFFGVFLLLRVPRDSGRELEDFCHLSAAFIKIFDLSLKLRRRFPQVDISRCLISHLLSSSPHYRFSSVTIRYDIRLP